MTYALLVALVLVGLICSSLWKNRGVGWITLDRPLALYSMFFLSYYLLPFIICERMEMIPYSQLTRIIALFGVAYIGFMLPTYVLKNTSTHFSGRRLSRAQQQSLYILSLLCMVLTVYVYSWRLKNGIFFNQARYYEQDMTVSASIRDVLLGGLQLPTILILAAVASGSCEKLARLGRTTMWSYGLGLIGILVLSSQTRPAVTAMILLLVATNTYSRLQIRPKYLAASLLAAFVSIVLVQGVRVIGAERVSSSENQLTSTLNIMTELSDTAAGELQQAIWQRTIDRAVGNVVFLSQIIEARDTGAPNLLGSGTFESLYSIIPRVLWRDKPMVLPGQIVFERKLGLQSGDAPLTLVNQLYAEGGWFAVLIGHFLLGVLLRILGPAAERSRNGAMYVIVACVWVSVVQIENDTIIGTLTGLRDAFVICASLWVLTMICRSTNARSHIDLASARA